jgi:hypothetical protein
MGLREFFRGTGGKVAAVALVIAAGFAVWYSARNSFATDPAMAMSTDRWFADTDGNTWKQKVAAGDMLPAKSPKTGKMNGYPAELCYWTADGQPKAVPDAVLVKSEWPELKDDSPTFCPVCHRLVKFHNPTPEQHPEPPETEEEYKKSREK